MGHELMHVDVPGRSTFMNYSFYFPLLPMLLDASLFSLSKDKPL